MSTGSGHDLGVTRVALHRLWAVFVTVVVGVAVVLPLVAPTQASTVPAVLTVGLAFSAGVAGLIGIMALDRTLATTAPADDSSAATELRTRLVLQAAIAEAPVLLAAALAFVFGPVWAVPVAAAPVVGGLLRVRPTQQRFGRFDRAWAALGSDVSLQRAIREA